VKRVFLKNLVVDAMRYFFAFAVDELYLGRILAIN